MTPAELDDTTQDLLNRLKAMRQAHEGLPEDELRKRLSSTLEDALADLPRERVEGTVDGLRAALVSEARNRQERIELLEREAAALTRERDELRASLAQRSAVQEQQGAPAGKDRGVDRIRRALTLLADGGGLTQGTTSLSLEDLQLLQVVESLYRFALHVTMASEQFKPGATGNVGDTYVGALGRQVRETFKACADGKPGSLKDLDQLLERARRFLPAVIGAYTTAVRGGFEAVLEVLDPQAIAKEHQRRAGLGINYEQAWKTFSESFEELQGLTPHEAWERFFKERFLVELARVTEGGPQKA